MEKVEIRSAVNGRIVLAHQQKLYTFPQKGARVKIDKDVFDEMIYSPGVDAMLKTGMLYIDDMSIKKEIGLEPEDATEPVNIIELTPARLKRLATAMPLPEFKAEMQKMSEVMQREVANYMVENSGAISMDRLNTMKEATGIDVLKAIELRKANDAPDTKEG